MMDAGVILFYLFYLCIFLTFTKYAKEHTMVSGALSLIIPVILPVAFAVSLAGFMAINGTDQLNSSSWTASYFASCDVNVQQEIFYPLGIYCIVISGFGVVYFYIKFFLYLYEMRTGEHIDLLGNDAESGQAVNEATASSVANTSAPGPTHRDDAEDDPYRAYLTEQRSKQGRTLISVFFLFPPHSGIL
jgi:FlaG/FlaF family flagellin (archaellin)